MPSFPGSGFTGLFDLGSVCWDVVALIMFDVVVVVVVVVGFVCDVLIEGLEVSFGKRDENPERLKV